MLRIARIVVTSVPTETDSRRCIHEAYNAQRRGCQAVKRLAIVVEARHLKRTGATAMLVGTWLTAINQGDVLVGDGWNSALLVKIGLNFLTPFLVANIGLLSRRD